MENRDEFGRANFIASLSVSFLWGLTSHSTYSPALAPPLRLEIAQRGRNRNTRGKIREGLAVKGSTVNMIAGKLFRRKEKCTRIFFGKRMKIFEGKLSWSRGRCIFHLHTCVFGKQIRCQDILFWWLGGRIPFLFEVITSYSFIWYSDRTTPDFDYI